MIVLPGGKSCKPVEVDGEKYLCTIWYSEEDKLWYGQSFETSHFPPVCQGESKEALIHILKKQINKDLRKE
jgi:hypothetical protein